MSEIINKIIEKKINKNCIFLGEDIKSPYGGAFKISKNLSKVYHCNTVLYGAIVGECIVGELAW